MKDYLWKEKCKSISANTAFFTHLDFPSNQQHMVWHTSSKHVFGSINEQMHGTVDVKEGEWTEL